MKKIRLKIATTVIIALLLSVVILSSNASAAVPQTMNYQGYLTNAAGTPVNGPVDIVFSLYSGTTGSEALWTEAHSVIVTNGVYNVVLGSVAPVQITLPFDEQYYLGIKVGADAEMTPQQALSSVPTAFRAREADGVPAGTITDVSISATAAIQASKISGLGSLATKSTIVDADVSPTAAIQASKISGLGALATKNSVDSTDIADGSIVNADISAAAAIVDTKLATISTAGKVADTALSSKVVLTDSTGDITLSGNLNLPATTATTGIIKSGGYTLMHTYGTNNFFAGLYAGNLTMTGSDNTSSGNSALYSNTTGTNNTAIGTLALSFNTSGDSNTANGYGALYANRTGFNNTAIGDSALSANTTGFYNTAIGISAGMYVGDNSANQTSKYSLYVGYDTRASADGDINEIVIGASAIGAGSNSVVIGNDSITKTLLKGNVGIGTALIFPDGTTQTTASAPTWGQIIPGAERWQSVFGGVAALDKETGLVWQIQTDETTKTWLNANYYCDPLGLGGRKGWRLPTVNELATLVDTTMFYPALPAGHPFTDTLYTLSNWYWSSTTFAPDPSSVMIVHFYDGSIIPTSPSGYSAVRCVRGGQ